MSNISEIYTFEQIKQLEDCLLRHEQQLQIRQHWGSLVDRLEQVIKHYLETNTPQPSPDKLNIYLGILRFVSTSAHESATSEQMRLSLKIIETLIDHSDDYLT